MDPKLEGLVEKITVRIFEGTSKENTATIEFNGSNKLEIYRIVTSFNLMEET